MSETLPPPPLPAEGDQPVTGSEPARRKPAQIAAMFTILAGAGMIASTFLAAWGIRGMAADAWFQFWVTTSLPDGRLFIAFGAMIAVIGAARLYADHVALRIVIALLGAYTVWGCVADGNAAVRNFEQAYPHTYWVLTFGPSLFLISAAAVIAFAASFVTEKNPYGWPRPRR